MNKKFFFKEKYLLFTEESNAIDYLERAGEFIGQTCSNKMFWKWVMLSLHGALYGFAIAACKGSTNQSVTRKTKSGRRKLITFDEALSLCQDPKWMGTLHGGVALAMSVGQKDSIRQLKATLRNNFEHYIPNVWSIEMHGLPRISIDVLDVIRFLAVETFRYQKISQTERKKIKSIVFRSKKALKTSALYRELLEAEK